MNPKQYNILKATPFKEPFDSKAGQLQRYYLTLEGLDQAISVAWDKRVDGGAPQVGPVWGELVDAVTKAGKPYKKFKKMSAPEGAQASVSYSGYDQPSNPQLDRIEGKIDLLLRHNKILAPAGPTLQDVKEVFSDDDQPPVDLYEEQINASEIPF